MQYRKIGQWGIRISEVGLGGWMTHGRSLTDDVTTRIVHRARDLGVTFFDTADAYNAGEAERALGEALAGRHRPDVVLATKCYFPISENPNDRGLSRKHIFESVHASLKRLQTDYIDLMQCHRYDADTPLEETVRAMDDLIRQGKILYWGVSDWSAAQIAEVVVLAKQMEACPPISNQPQYNLFNRHIEDGILPTSERFGLGQVIYSPLAQGVLTGKYRPGAPIPEGSRGADESSNMWMGWILKDENLEKVVRLEVIAKDLGVTVTQLSLAWILRQSGVSSVIVGATRPEQLEESVGASGLSYGEDVWKRVDEAFG